MSVAGHIQSGGFGSFSKRFGTSSAHLPEAEVVTADGAIRIANAHRNADLLWALKGGGGGGLGVITRVTLRTHDLPATFGWASGRIRASSDAAYLRLVSRLLAFYSDGLFNAHWGEQISIRPENVLKISMVSQGLNDEESVAIWREFIDWVRASPGDFSIVENMDIGAAPARGWWDAAARRKRGSDRLRPGDHRHGGCAGLYRYGRFQARPRLRALERRACRGVGQDCAPDRSHRRLLSLGKQLFQRRLETRLLGRKLSSPERRQGQI